ncbi:Uncharacterized conserved protein YjiS, DUF1127 family [Bosea sp. CRIB-10]|nr:Uncharacterized conserved protein YjiS, DUF1127 family [Bosea sp. CRIB-10]
MHDAAPTLVRSPQTAPRGILAIWRERIRVRWKLAQMAQENPHLLEDIGLTKQQVEAEIAKRFWQR